MTYEQSLGATGAEVDLAIKNLTTERDVAQQQVATLQNQLVVAVDLNVNLKATIEQKNILVAQQAAEIARLNALLTPQPPQPPVVVPVVPAAPTGWQTTYSDDFRKPALDLTKWTVKTGPLGAPREEYNRAENITTGSGLVITTKREEFGGKHWTSSYVTSDNLMEFDMNSRIEVEFKMDDIWDNASGLWPCPIWLRFDGPGEIDGPEMYGWPFLNPARVNASENALSRGNGQYTVHSNTAGGTANKKTVRVPANVPGGLIKPGVLYTAGIEITDAGITSLFQGKPVVDVYQRPNPMTWDYLATQGIPKTAYSGKGHARIQTQVGDSYWGPSGPGTKSPWTMTINWFRIMKKV